MEIKIQLDPMAIMPTRAHMWDAGLDLYAADTKTVPGHGRMTFDTGVHIQIPAGYTGLIRSRSGLMANFGIVTDGTIDSGYTGSIQIVLFDLNESGYQVNRGDKIAQIVFVKCELVGLNVVDKLDESDRGDNGFGSTGV